MRYAIGVDLGGTNIRVSSVDETGKIYKTIKESTNANSVEKLLVQIENMIDQIINDYDYCGIGLGVPGPVIDQSSVLYFVNIPISGAINFKEPLESKYHIPVYVANDANAAGLCEALVGAGKDYNVVQYVTISTGVGGGLVIDKKMILGKTCQAQEVGSMIINKHGHISNNSKPDGSIESEISGKSLALKAKEKGLDIASAGDIFKLAATNNKIALDIENEFIENLAIFIANIVNYLEPDVFILGGGVMKSKEYFFDKITPKVESLLPDSLKGNVTIIPAKYDQECGIIGAALQCFK